MIRVFICYSSTDDDRFYKICNELRKVEEVFEGQDQIEDTVIPHSGSLTLLLGECGTGKELFAQAIHNFGMSADESLIAEQISAINDNLIESQLFGHERRAFTGADKQHTVFFEKADAGTLFLDEIGDLPIALQVRLLRVIQEGEFRCGGGTQNLPFQARLICASYRNLAEEVSHNRFRLDLFQRISEVTIMEKLKEALAGHDQIEEIRFAFGATLSDDFANHTVSGLMSSSPPILKVAKPIDSQPQSQLANQEYADERKLADAYRALREALSLKPVMEELKEAIAEQDQIEELEEEVYADPKLIIEISGKTAFTTSILRLESCELKLQVSDLDYQVIVWESFGNSKRRVGTIILSDTHCDEEVFNPIVTKQFLIREGCTVEIAFHPTFNEERDFTGGTLAISAERDYFETNPIEWALDFDTEKAADFVQAIPFSKNALIRRPQYELQQQPKPILSTIFSFDKADAFLKKEFLADKFDEANLRTFYCAAYAGVVYLMCEAKLRDFGEMLTFNLLIQLQSSIPTPIEIDSSEDRNYTLDRYWERITLESPKDSSSRGHYFHLLLPTALGQALVTMPKQSAPKRPISTWKISCQIKNANSEERRTVLGTLTTSSPKDIEFYVEKLIQTLI